MDRDPELASWILTSFTFFLKALQKGVFDVLKHSSTSESFELPKIVSKETIYCFPEFKAFPYYESPITELFYKVNIVNKKTGSLVWIKEACVVKVHKPEFYLWVQTFEPSCVCSEHRGREIFKNHR